MNFKIFRAKFERRLDFLDDCLVELVSDRKSKSPFEFRVVLEGIVSTAWQIWSRSCRDIVISSCLGAVTEGGVVLTPSLKIIPPQWERVSYVAIRSCNGSTIQPALINGSLWREPTWGDVSKLQIIISATDPSNKMQLASAFGVMQKIKDLQVVRNAIAHANGETHLAVLAIAPKYIASSIRFSSEAALWEDVGSKSFAFHAWTEEMRDAIALATA